MTSDIADEQASVLESVVRAFLQKRTPVLESDVQQAAEAFRAVAARDLHDDQVGKVVARLLTQLSVSVETGVAITSKEFKQWLAGSRKDISWRRWLDYKSYLNTVSGLPPKVVEKLDEATDRMLDYAGDPRIADPWSRRGLVIGDVQSGKTANYLGLLNKATDAGYTLIIVLAGNTESLRRQTQERLEEGLIGRSSRLAQAMDKGALIHNSHTGVGKLDQSFVRAQGMTTVMSDFRTASNQLTNFSIDRMTSTPHVFVLKKNKAVLNAVKTWLASQPSVGGKLDVPMLLLDDESDYASVNTRGPDNPTAINEAIRGILAVTRRSSYVAFTATPFANIFIDHDEQNDLFPKDYIVALESPSNYFGARRTFRDPESERTVEKISDAEPSFPLGHKSTLEVVELPESLNEALRTFLLVNAIRDIRSHAQRRSMLINVSRFKRVQSLVGESVESEVIRLKNAIEHHALAYAQGVPNSTIESLKATYERRYADTETTWEEVLIELPSSVKDVRVKVFNSDTVKAEEGALESDRMIAVGGDVLSRGLTLEGLTVSYFYRRVGASDTLFQMARWFGYRSGYDDLCRLWIEPDTAADFVFVFDQIEELREDLRRMEALKLTPVRFGLAVRKHPGTLLVTARNKMKAADSRPRTVSLAGRNIESVQLSPCPHVAASNLDAVRDLVRAIESDGRSIERVAGLIQWPQAANVPKALISRFLAQFQAADSAVLFDGTVLSDFALRATSDEMQNWRVVFAEGLGETVTLSEHLSVCMPGRTIDGSADPLRVSAKSARLAGSTDIANLVPSNERTAIRSQASSVPDVAKAVSERDYYPVLGRPALLIYPLDLSFRTTGLDLERKHTVSLPRHRCATHSDSNACSACTGCRNCEALDRGPETDTRAFSDVDALVAIKVAIPGHPLAGGSSSGDVTYVINTVAQQRWLVEAPLVDSDTPSAEEEDLDE